MHTQDSCLEYHVIHYLVDSVIPGNIVMCDTRISGVMKCATGQSVIMMEAIVTYPMKLL